jgi:hypothetical protein
MGDLFPNSERDELIMIVTLNYKKISSKCNGSQSVHSPSNLLLMDKVFDQFTTL